MTPDEMAELLSEAEAELERRRKAIAHLLRWKMQALKLLTDEQVTLISIREKSDAPE